jgi:hypothetical protein
MDKIKNQIGMVEAKAAYLSSCLPVMCPNYPKERACDGFDRFVLVFSRSLKRYCYFLKMLLNKIDTETSKFTDKDLNNGQDFMSVISDDIFFIFDAYLFSCKGIFEKNIYRSNNNISDDLAKKLAEIGQEHKSQSLFKMLRIMRNEVAHLNAYGSGIGSSIHIKSVANESNFSIPTEFTDENNERLCLISISTNIWQLVHSIISDIFNIIFTETIRRYGIPRNDSEYHCGELSVRLSDF